MASLVLLVAVAALPGADAYLTGWEAQQESRFDDAVAAYRTCAGEAGPLQPYARLRAAECLSLSGDIEAGEAEYRQLLDVAPAGPWVRMAQTHLARLLHEQGRHKEAVPLFSAGLAVSPQPWWYYRYEWWAAENLLADPETKESGYVIARRLALSAPDSEIRLAAARQLAQSSNSDDIATAVLALIRASAYGEAGTALLSLAPHLLTEESQRAQWRYLNGLVLSGGGEETEGKALLDQVWEDHPASLWARLALAHLANAQVRKGDFAAAEATCDTLATAYPGSKEAGNALWTLARTYAAKQQTQRAISQFLRLADGFPDHTQADEALLDAGHLLVAAGETERALELYGRILRDYPSGASASAAWYASGAAHETRDHPEKAVAAYREAAQGGLGDYYAHRASARLQQRGLPLAPAHGDTEPMTRKLPPFFSGEHAFLGLLPIPAPSAQEPPGDNEVGSACERLRFFAAHGLDESEWEAVGLAETAKDAERGVLYGAMAEAGVVHTAWRLANHHNWGVGPEGSSVERSRVRFPRAHWTLVKDLGRETGVDPYLILAVALKESTFRPGVTSSAGAKGVMQFMPSTAAWLAQIQPGLEAHHAANLVDPRNSLRLGAYYLKRLIERWDGNIVYAVAAYNAGPGNLDRWRKLYGSKDMEAFIESIPFPETRDYTKKVLAGYAAYHSLYSWFENAS